jgi:hypothetical protein
MLKKLLIKWLFRLIKIETNVFVTKKEKEELQEIMSRLANSTPFRKYLIGKEINCYEQLRQGVKVEDYHILRGRLLEIVSLRNKINEIDQLRRKEENKKTEDQNISLN